VDVATEAEEEDALLGDVGAGGAATLIDMSYWREHVRVDGTPATRAQRKKKGAAEHKGSEMRDIKDATPASLSLPLRGERPSTETGVSQLASSRGWEVDLPL
jgi:hypothetical protein